MLKLKQNKGITLIALIITIIVMLILVAVTVTVALNGGLFDKAEEAATLTTIEQEKEALNMAALSAWESGEGVVFEKMEIPEGFQEVTKGTYKNRKTGRIYTIDQKTAKITEEGDNLTGLRKDLEGKIIDAVINEDGFINTEIKLLSSDETTGIVLYRGEKFLLTVEKNNEGEYIIAKVEKYIETVIPGTGTDRIYGPIDGFMYYILTASNEITVVLNGQQAMEPVAYEIFYGTITELLTAYPIYKKYEIEDEMSQFNKFVLVEGRIGGVLSENEDKYYIVAETDANTDSVKELQVGYYGKLNTELKLEDIIQ